MKRIILGILLILEVILISGVMPHQFKSFNSRSFNRAFYEWRKNPTPETELRMRQLADRARRVDLNIQISIWIMLALNSGLILLMWRKVFTRPPEHDTIPRGGLPGA
jgi:hypothetical protein